VFGLLEIDQRPAFQCSTNVLDVLLPTAKHSVVLGQDTLYRAL